MKKIFVLFAVLLALMPVAVFAGGSSESSSSDGPVTIKYYTWEDSAHKPLIDAFNATHDDIQVDAEILPSANYEARLNTLLAGRVEMDAFMEKRQTDMFVQYNNGYIEPLNDYIVEGSPADVAVKAYESQMVYNGDILGIPWRGGAYYVYYNKKVFDACGVPYPSEYIENGEWTWDKFVEVSKALTNPELGTVGSCIYIWANGTMFIEAQNHKPIIDADGNIDFDDGFLRMLQIKKELEGAGAMVPLTDMKVTGTHYSNLFYNGNLGMLIIGEWFPGQMTTGERDGLLNGFTASDYGICRLPCDQAEYTTLGASTNNHVTSYSKSNPSNETDYTDGYGNYEFSLTTRGKVTASFTIDVRSKTDAAEIKTGVQFDYDGITWQVVNPNYSGSTGKHTLSFTGNYVSVAVGTV